MKKQKEPEDKDKNSDGKHLLSQNPVTAVKEIIRQTNLLTDIMTEEMNVLTTGNMIAFISLQDRKEKMATLYQKFSVEFRQRANDFKGMERTLLDELEKTQRTLHNASRDNAACLEKMNRAALQKTQKTLLMTQEIGALSQNNEEKTIVRKQGGIQK